MSKYELQKCTDKDLWDDFVESSPQGSIFATTKFIDCLEVNYANYLLHKGKEIIGGVSVLEDKNGEPRKAPFDFTAYQSILCRHVSGAPVHTQIEEEFKITEIIINELIRIYGKVSLVHSPFLKDIRPFLWHNYHHPEKGMFDYSVWYTPILDLTFSGIDEYLASIRTCRRQEFRKKINCHTYETTETRILNELHRRTFERQGIERAEVEGKLLLSISNRAVENNFGRISVCEVDGVPASAILFLYDTTRGYYLFGANNPDFRSAASSTKLLVENIMHTKNEKRLKQVDFVGCNSPQRGDYKLSFNAQLYPYFETHFNMNK